MTAKYRPLLAAMALQTLALSGAQAWEPFRRATCPTGIWWPENPTLHVNEGSLGQAPYSDSQFLQATKDMVDQINAVPGSSFRIGVETTGASDLSNGRSELWATAQLPEKYADKSANLVGVTDFNVNFFAKCQLVESDIIIDHTTELWRPDTPQESGKRFWMGPTSADERLFFRKTALHELLHFSGFAHETDELSLLNYFYAIPWANEEDPADSLSPLPTDRAGLRAYYPGEGDETDIVLLNMWVTDTIEEEPNAAYADRLCTPAKGFNYEYPFHDVCAEGDYPWCADSLIHAKVALANRGKAQTQAQVRLFFHTSPTLAEESPATQLSAPVSVPPGKTILAEFDFRIPSFPDEFDGKALYTIAQAVAVGEAAGDANNVMPSPRSSGKLYEAAACVVPPPPVDPCEEIAESGTASCTIEFNAACGSATGDDCKSRTCCESPTVHCCTPWMSEGI